MPRLPVQSTKFKKDIRRLEKRGKDMAKLRRVLLLLIEQHPLPAEHGDHPLLGEWHGLRDLHIEPDWLLL